jgi:hypothetical protein
VSNESYYRGWSHGKFGWSPDRDGDRDYRAGFERGQEEAREEERRWERARERRREEERLECELFEAAMEDVRLRQAEEDYFTELANEHGRELEREHDAWLASRGAEWCSALFAGVAAPTPRAEGEGER